MTLSGAAYGPISGYNVQLDQDWGVGFVVGAAYEIPDIAGRVSLTYNSKVEHQFDTVESVNGTISGDAPPTTVDTARIKLDPRSADRRRCGHACLRQHSLGQLV